MTNLQEKEPNNDRAQASLGIETPEPSDCVFGRGRSFQCHPGNIFLHQLVDARLEDYRKAKAGHAKNSIIESIMRAVQDGKGDGAPRGRFLKRGATIGKKHILWEEVSDKDAKTKVGHTIRSRMRAVDIANGTILSQKRQGLDASSGLITNRISGLAARTSSSVKPREDSARILVPTHQPVSGTFGHFNSSCTLSPQRCSGLADTRHSHIKVPPTTYAQLTTFPQMDLYGQNLPSFVRAPITQIQGRPVPGTMLVDPNPIAALSPLQQNDLIASRLSLSGNRSNAADLDLYLQQVLNYVHCQF